MQILRSFEDSNRETFGDLLSRKREKRRLKVGLILFGYFEYWRMFTDELRKQVENDMRYVEEKLAEKYDIVSTDLVDTLDAADLSGRILQENQVDAIILVMGTYVPDYITMHALDYVRELPLLLFSAQHDEVISESDTYMSHARDSCMTAAAQLSATLNKIGRKHRTVVGSVADESAYRKIAVFLDALQAVLDLREANIGLLGNVFRGMYDIELSKTFLKGKFDVNTIYIQESHLLQYWENTTKAETQCLAESLKTRFRSKIVDDQDILQACRLALALEKLADAYRLDGLCLLDQHYLQQIYHTTSRIGASLLLEKRGFPVCVEGDLGSLVVALLMQSLSGKNPFQGSWCSYDADADVCLIQGHGVADPALAGSDENVLLTRTPEEWGMKSPGLNYEFEVVPGKCTISSLVEKPGGYSMLISGGETVHYRELHNDEVHAFVRMNQPIKEYYEKILCFGVTQHCMLCPCDIREQMEAVADQLGLEKLTI